MYKKLIAFFMLLIIVSMLPVFVYSLLTQSAGETLVVDVYRHRTGEIEQMRLDDYLKGVVAAEMPVVYDMEALKAQAVAARTYTLRQLVSPGENADNYSGADVTTDFRYNQAWISRDEMKEKWGYLPYLYFYIRISEAVEETAGEILVYEDRIIDAVYHSNSGGQTSSGEDVWGSNGSPYLQSVSSPYDGDREGNYRHQFTFSREEFVEKLQLDNPGSFSGAVSLDFRRYDTSGRVLEVDIAGKRFTGREVREQLELPSTKFSFSLQDDEIICDVWGFGHGVGMSQDGADGYGRRGYSYRRILNHYYSGIEIVDYRQSDIF